MFLAICRTVLQAPVKDEEPENDLSLAELSNPLDGEELKASGRIRPVLPPEMIPAGPKVPNFHGKTKRQVMEESSALGVPCRDRRNRYRADVRSPRRDRFCAPARE